MSDAGYLAQIPDFTGNLESDLKWELFNEKFENLAKCAGWEDEKKVTMLVSKLNNRALEFYGRCRRINYGRKLTYDEVKEKIKSRFAIELAQEEYQMRFIGCKQQPGEDPKIFADRLESLSELAYPVKRQIINKETQEVIDEARDQRLKNAFILGAETKLKLYLREKEPKTFEKAVKLAIKRKILFQEEPQLEYDIIDRVGFSNQSKSIQCRYCKKNGHNIEDCRSRQRSKSNQNRPQFQCFNCGKEGHYAKDCRERQSRSRDRYYRSKKPNTSLDRTSERSKSRESNRSSRRERERTCFNCDKPGHLAKDCKLKRRNRTPSIDRKNIKNYDSDISGNE